MLLKSLRPANLPRFAWRSSSRAVQALDLSFNGIGVNVTFATALSRTLPRLTSLTSLSLASNSFTVSEPEDALSEPESDTEVCGHCQFWA